MKSGVVGAGSWSSGRLSSVIFLSNLTIGMSSLSLLGCGSIS